MGIRGKNLKRIVAICFVAIALGSFLAQQFGIRERFPVPDYYRNLDTTLPFNVMARAGLDLRISNGEYDAIRWQYFEDRVSPQYGPLQQTAAWEDFKARTERPDVPGRTKTLQDYESYFDLAFLISTLYLAAACVLWLWSKVLRPTKVLVQSEGLNGLFHRVLFGRKGRGDRA